MAADAIAILERLLTQEPVPENVHYLKESRDFFDAEWTYQEMEAIEAELAREFRLVAAEVEKAWGPPDFIGCREESEFPEFYPAEELCYWRRGDVVTCWH